MEVPGYCVIFDRAFKSVRSPGGGLAFLVYSPAMDEFEPVTAGEVVRQFLLGDETDRVSEEAFDALVAAQRAEAKAKREGRGGSGH